MFELIASNLSEGFSGLSGGPSFHEKNPYWSRGFKRPGGRGGYPGPPHCRLCEAVSSCPSLRPHGSAYSNTVKTETAKLRSFSLKYRFL